MAFGFGRKKKDEIRKRTQPVLDDMADKLIKGEISVRPGDPKINLEEHFASEADEEEGLTIAEEADNEFVEEIGGGAFVEEPEILEPDEDDFTDVAESLNDMGGESEPEEAAPASKRDRSAKKPAKGAQVTPEEAAAAAKRRDRLSIPIIAVTTVICVAVVAGIKFGKTTHELLPMAGLMIIGLCFSAGCPLAILDDKANFKRSGGIMTVTMFLFLGLAGIGGWFYYQAFL
ncbi:hypothetical protein KJ652_00270 [Patescibacteria group bacterium]|nr:hypothetical protein [Patescibacteria group bacterium]MBU1123008.1 hypothetical protein [Patescibacteria group bacterium]MBU1911384.1 hypothetical protein [Patescibacteria group bacterium]